MIRERLTGVGVALLGLVIFFVLIPWGIDQPGNVEHTALAPDFWPQIIAVIMMALGVLQAVRPVPDDEDEDGGGGGGGDDGRDGGGGGRRDGGGGGRRDGGGDSGRWVHRLPGLAVALGALFGFYVLIPSLGMVAPGVAVIFALMVFGGERRWGLAATVAAGVPILLYAFFVHVAGIPIPLGVFETLRG